MINKESIFNFVDGFEKERKKIMLIVIKNTYPNVNLKPGDEVVWHYVRGCYYLYKISEQDIRSKSYFISPNCNRDGIKPNGKQVDLVGIVGQLNLKVMF